MALVDMELDLPKCPCVGFVEGRLLCRVVDSVNKCGFGSCAWGEGCVGGWNAGRDGTRPSISSMMSVLW